jgi:hypothetical protein
MKVFIHKFPNPLTYIDHLKGLTKPLNGNKGSWVSNESWNHGTIYTSEASREILLLRFPQLKPYVIGLKL